MKSSTMLTAIVSCLVSSGVVVWAGDACSSALSVKNGRALLTGETITLGALKTTAAVVSQDSVNTQEMWVNTDVQPADAGFADTALRVDMAGATPKVFPGATPIITRMGGNTLAMAYITTASQVQTRFSFDGEFWLDGRQPMPTADITDTIAMAGDGSALCLAYRSTSSPFAISGTCSSGMTLGAKSPAAWLSVQLSGVTQQTSVSKARIAMVPADGTSGTFVVFSEFTSGGVDIILFPGGGTSATLRASLGAPAVARQSWSVASNPSGVIMWANLDVEGLLTATKSTDGGKSWSPLVSITTGAINGALALIYTEKWIVVYSAINAGIPALKSTTLSANSSANATAWTSPELLHGGDTVATDLQRSLVAMNIEANSEGFAVAWVQQSSPSTGNTFKIQSVFCPYASGNATSSPTVVSTSISGGEVNSRMSYVAMVAITMVFVVVAM